MLKQLFILVLCLVFHNANGQHSFVKSFGSNSMNEIIYRIKELPTGGFILFGISSPDKVNTARTYWSFIRTNEIGDTLFYKKISGLGCSTLFMDVDTNGNIVFGGGSSDNYIHLFRLDTSTNEITEKEISISFQDSTHYYVWDGIKYLPGKGFITWGRQDYDLVFLSEMNFIGEKIWLRTYKDMHNYTFISDVAITRSGFFISGEYKMTLGNRIDAFSIVTDSAGNAPHENIDKDSFGYGRQIYSAVHAKDSGFFEMGIEKYPSFSVNSFYKLAENNLDTIFSKRFYFDEDSTSIYYHLCFTPSMIAASDGGAYAFASSDIYSYFLVKFDKDGNIVWSRILDAKYFNTYIAQFNDMIETSDGGLAFAGWNHLNRNSNDVNYYYVKISIDSLLGVDEAHVEKSFIKLFPNPAISTLHLQTDIITNATIEITDLSGRIVYTSKLSSPQKDIDISSFSKGMYLLHYHDGNTVWNGKFVKG